MPRSGRRVFRVPAAFWPTQRQRFDFQAQIIQSHRTSVCLFYFFFTPSSSSFSSIVSRSGSMGEVNQSPRCMAVLILIISYSIKAPGGIPTERETDRRAHRHGLVNHPWGGKGRITKSQSENELPCRCPEVLLPHMKTFQTEDSLPFPLQFRKKTKQTLTPVYVRVAGVKHRRAQADNSSKLSSSLKAQIQI